jgi:CHAT domain-containing protein
LRRAVYLTFPLVEDSTNVVVERVDLGKARPIDEAVGTICRRMSAGQFEAKDLGSARGPRAVAGGSPATNQAPIGSLARLLAQLLAPHVTSLSRDYRGFKFTPLPGAEAEARGVAALLGGDTVLRLGAEAREAALKPVVSPRVLHLCTHGFFLSVKIGQGVMSLRRALRIAGVQTVLASHWPVNDRAAGRLMTEFIRRWHAGESRAQAWRGAQLSLRRSPEFASPYFWAAFTLTGQWR